VLSDLPQPLSKAPLSVSYHWFEQTLPILASHTRKDLFSDLSALLLWFTYLGGEDTAREIYLAVRDVTTWWP